MLQQATKSIRLVSALLQSYAKQTNAKTASSPSANNFNSQQSSELTHKQIMTCLNCLSHFFTWIPLNQAPIQGELLDNLFLFASLGVEGSREVSNQHEQQGLAAIHTLYELVALGGIPQNYEEFLAHLFALTFKLLEKLLSMTEGFSKLDDKYLERCAYLGLY